MAILKFGAGPGIPNRAIIVDFHRRLHPRRRRPNSRAQISCDGAASLGTFVGDQNSINEWWARIIH